MTSISRAHHAAPAHKTAATHAAVPSEVEIRAIRHTYSDGNSPDDVSGALPKGVGDYEKKLQKKEKDSEVGVQTFTVGTKRYFEVRADNEGNGYADIVDPKGKYVTGYSYSESEGPNWAASPQEMKREAAVGSAAADLFKRSSLGTAKLSRYEISKNALPEKLQSEVANHNVQVEKFYKANLNGVPVFVDYVKYSGIGNKPNDDFGDVTVYDTKGDWLGSADIKNKSKDRLFFSFSLGRPE